VNKVIFIGNLTRDPELSTIPSGVSVCKFSIAVNRKFAGADGQRDTDFFNITAWRGLGENCAKFLKKGNKVCVVGQIQTRTYEQDGIKKYAVDVIADDVEFLTPKNGGESSSEMTPVTDDSLPF
jgi:single-strand DNA-binding protein